MKKIKYILSFFLGALMFGSISIYAVNQVNADMVEYNGNTLDQAIDTIYNAVKPPCQNITGNKNTISTMYICDLGDGVKRKMFVLKVEDNTVKLISERNINNNYYSHSDALDFFKYGGDGYSIAQSWTNVESVDLPGAQEIADAVNNTNWVLSANSSSFYLGPNNSNLNRLEINAKAAWLADNLSQSGCGSYKISNKKGYWTKDIDLRNNGKAWRVSCGSLNTTTSDSTGIRPVVTMLKSRLS